jgi:(4-(4-[2-(gamma-L-glutamylamino)ethyl]phenoxymethyl)furan-2-yl)methanamine synthase
VNSTASNPDNGTRTCACQLPAGVDLMATADGRAKSVEASRARLARMVGRDAHDADDAAWAALARWFAEAQIRTVVDGAELMLSNRSLTADAPIITAGIGEAVLQEVARRLGRRHIAFGTMLDVAPEARERVSYCAPATSLALLASSS